MMKQEIFDLTRTIASTYSMLGDSRDLKNYLFYVSKIVTESLTNTVNTFKTNIQIFLKLCFYNFKWRWKCIPSADKVAHFFHWWQREWWTEIDLHFNKLLSYIVIRSYPNYWHNWGRINTSHWTSNMEVIFNVLVVYFKVLSSKFDTARQYGFTG